MFDKEYQLSASAQQIMRISSEKYRELDKQYDISGKAKAAEKTLKEGTNKLNEWLEKQ